MARVDELIPGKNAPIPGTICPHIGHDMPLYRAQYDLMVPRR